MVYRKH